MSECLSSGAQPLNESPSQKEGKSSSKQPFEWETNPQ